MASLCIVTSIDSAVDLTVSVCMLTVTTVGVCSHFPDKGEIRMESCTPGITFDYLGCPVPSKHVYSLHCFYFHLHIYCFCR